MLEKPIDFDKFVRLLIGGLIILALYILLDRLSAVLIPFFLAWLTAYLLEPIVLFVQRLFKRRTIAVLSTLVGLFLVFALMLTLLIPAIAEEVQSVQNLLSTQMIGMEWPAWIPHDAAMRVNHFLSSFDWKELLGQKEVIEKAASAVSSVWEVLSNLLGVVGAMFGVITYLLYLIFIMLDYNRIANGWSALIPEKFKPFVVDLVNNMEVGMNGYFRAQTKIVLSVAVLFAVGFKIIGLPFALSLGLLLGLLNYIPYAQLFGIIPAIGLAALHSIHMDASFLWMVILVLIVFVVVQLIQEIFLTPRFLGEFSGFNPAVILLSLSIWGALLGVVGIIIAIPMTSVVLAYYKRYVLKDS